VHVPLAQLAGRLYTIKCLLPKYLALNECNPPVGQLAARGFGVHKSRLLAPQDPKDRWEFPPLRPPPPALGAGLIRIPSGGQARSGPRWRWRRTFQVSAYCIHR
jgi:hypothetical protein